MTTPANAPSRIARGGKAIYGAPLGILMLEARFPAFPATWATAPPGRSPCFIAS